MAGFRTQRPAVQRALLAVPVIWASCFDVLDLGGPAGDRGPDTSRWGDPASAPCDDPHHAGDGRSGLQCWDPPDNYCLHGTSPTDTWYCKQDASKCCRAETGGCFRCGWVQMKDCVLAGATEGAPAPDCAALKAGLPEIVRSCLERDAAAVECRGVLTDPECSIETEQWVCPEA